jgi:hypothetical protein
MLVRIAVAICAADVHTRMDNGDLLIAVVQMADEAPVVVRDGLVRRDLVTVLEQKQRAVIGYDDIVCRPFAFRCAARCKEGGNCEQ